MRAMKTAKAAKGERRAHRKAKDRRRRDDRLSMQVLGGIMEPELYERVLAAAQGLDLEAPWDAVSPMILPVLKRVRHPYPVEAAPLHIHVPPGIWTGFGIDFGPAFGHVSAPMVERWGVDRATLLATSLENLRRLIVDEPPQVQHVDFDGVDLLAIQGQGWGSSLLLLPDALDPILGPAPRTLLAPVRNTVIALPEDAEVELAIGVWQALADGAHDELEVDPMRWTGRTIVSIGDRSLGLPN